MRPPAISASWNASASPSRSTTLEPAIPSLSYLHRLPIDSIKVDRSFVRQITQCDESKAIVRAIVAMANSLDLQVIAEGVETEDQLSAVAKEGCHLIQGYLFSRPLSVETISGLLQECAHEDQLAPEKIPCEKVSSKAGNAAGLSLLVANKSARQATRALP